MSEYAPNPTPTPASQRPFHPLENAKRLIHIDNPTRLSSVPLPYPNLRYREGHLANRNGFAIYTCNDRGEIESFTAAAFRRKESETRDVVVMVTHDMILQGIKAGKQPEVALVYLEGEDRRGHFTVRVPEIPFLSAWLGVKIPTASGWGVLRVGPVSDKRSEYGNTENYLHPDSWKDYREHGAPPGMGGVDLVARLAPGALDFAKKQVTAWDLALAMASTYGGMKIPEIGYCGGIATLQAQLDGEVALQKEQALARTLRRATGKTQFTGVKFADALDKSSVSSEVGLE